MLTPHKTRIVATIGPASSSPAVITDLIRAGMSVARLNFSHGDLRIHQAAIDALRAAARAANRRVAIMADLPGPKMRIGEIPNGPIELRAGERFTLTTEDVPGDTSRVSVTFAQLPERVHAGDTLFLNDGAIQLEVTAASGRDVHCRVLVGGELRSKKGLNVPGIDLGVRAFTERDRSLLEFALGAGVDAISQSFVESAGDVRDVREAAAALGKQPFVIAKIERKRAIDHLDEILEAADGVMIARGDLGVEIPIERIAVVQKAVMRQANLRGRPVITATQMLESMTSNTRPTRAEATDVANAILDGTDAVMLSGESAMGQFPVEAVRMLARIAAAAEPYRATRWAEELLRDRAEADPAHLADAIVLSVYTAVQRLEPAFVIAPTRSGATARNLARFRLPMWVVAVCRQESVCQHLQFSYGVHPVAVSEPPDDWRAFARRFMREQGLAGRLAVLAAGPSPRNPEANHRMEVIDLG